MKQFVTSEGFQTNVTKGYAILKSGLGEDAGNRTFNRLVKYAILHGQKGYAQGFSYYVTDKGVFEFSQLFHKDLPKMVNRWNEQKPPAGSP